MLWLPRQWLSAEANLGQLQLFDLQNQPGFFISSEVRFISLVLTRVNLDLSSCPAQAPNGLSVTKQVFHCLLLPSVLQQLENTAPLKPFSPACCVPHRGEVLLKEKK